MINCDISIQFVPSLTTAILNNWYTLSLSESNFSLQTTVIYIPIKTCTNPTLTYNWVSIIKSKHSILGVHIKSSIVHNKTKNEIIISFVYFLGSASVLYIYYKMRNCSSKFQRNVLKTYFLLLAIVKTSLVSK